MTVRDVRRLRGRARHARLVAERMAAGRGDAAGVRLLALAVARAEEAEVIATRLLEISELGRLPGSAVGLPPRAGQALGDAVEAAERLTRAAAARPAAPVRHGRA